MRVGLDCFNGSTVNTAKSVFDALGAKTYVVGNEPDGTNINMGCGSTHIENPQNNTGIAMIMSDMGLFKAMK